MNNFYRNILPSQGVYCVTSIGKNGFARNLFAATLDDLSVTIDTAKSGDNNVFVALNSFKGHSRKADNAAYCRSFFIDLDVGGDKAYDSKDSALIALEEFLAKTELPPPVRVDSGNGIHAYWPFEEDVESTEWKHYAEKFKQYCLAQGLGIDPTVTADAARVLRCPDTYNHKRTPPVPTKLLDEEINSYAFESFREFLDLHQPGGLNIAGIIKGLDEDSAAVAKKNDENFEYIFTDIAIKSLEGQGCNQVKFILENAQALPEPLWYAGLSVAVRCADGATAIHDMSIDYEGYSHDETERKAAQSLREANWAHGCDAFYRLNPDACKGCQFRGQITSPIRIGRRLRLAVEGGDHDIGRAEDGPAEAAGQEEGTEANAVRQEAGTPKKGVNPLPAELFPFLRGVNGCIFYQPPPAVDKEGNKKETDPIKVFNYDVYPVKRVKATTGDSLIVRTVTPMDPMQEFVLPISSAYVKDELKKLLPNNGVYPQPNAMAYVGDYFTKWAQYLQDRETADMMRSQMGWVEDKSSFILGNTEIMASGTSRATAAAPSIKVQAKLVDKSGSYDIWKRHAQYLNRPGWELHAFGMLCGFGSPLMTFTPNEGVTVCFMNADSGTGKTGSMYAGLSIFSKPHDSSVMDGSATDNAFIGRYLAFKNMMFAVDEVSNIGPEKLSALIHRISQGRAKLRMQSSVNAEREIEQTASMIAMFTSNKDLYELLRTFKGSPDGEMARLMQFVVRKPHEMLVDGHGREVFDAFNENYGHAGPEFIQHLYRKGLHVVREIVNKWLVRIEQEFTADSAYRHYASALAAAFAGGELANEAGIVSYDIERIFRAMMVEVMQLKDNTVKLNQIDYKSMLADFINAHHSGFLILDSDRVVSEPRMELVGRIEVHNGLQIIAKKAIREYLAPMQVSANEFEKAMKRDGMLVESKKCRISTGWKAGLTTPPVASYVFKSDNLQEILAKTHVA